MTEKDQYQSPERQAAIAAELREYQTRSGKSTAQIAKILALDPRQLRRWQRGEGGLAWFEARKIERYTAYHRQID